MYIQHFRIASRIHHWYLFGLVFGGWITWNVAMSFYSGKGIDGTLGDAFSWLCAPKVVSSSKCNSATLQYSRTLVKDHLGYETTLLLRPLFTSPV